MSEVKKQVISKPRLILVTGQVGAGKTSYSLAQAEQIQAVCFSIDSWMQTLFVPDTDIKNPNYDWMIERVYRCYDQIWQTASQILQTGGHVILDLGFTERAQRQQFIDKGLSIGVQAELHYLNVDTNIRKQQVAKRNTEKDPKLYAFEVTEQMFDFMETRFEVPSADELQHGKTITRALI
ncbi:AAA family ATPase [Agaribacter flavus]|uniref:AAA family ATPase n=1 Tax=Agaribacter flavus TaxID=1902781 RepID=A0ABV7FPR0_9ALTE